MALTEQDFSIVQGDFKRLRFSVSGLDDIDEIDNVYWFAEDIKKTQEDIEVDRENNEIVFDIYSEETKDWCGWMNHELKIVDGDGNVSTLAQGNITVKHSSNIIEEVR